MFQIERMHASTQPIAKQNCSHNAAAAPQKNPDTEQAAPRSIALTLFVHKATDAGSPTKIMHLPVSMKKQNS